VNTAIPLLFLLSVPVAAARTDRAVLELSVVDSGSAAQVPARVRVRDSLGSDHVPAGAVVVPILKLKAEGSNKTSIDSVEATHA